MCLIIPSLLLFLSLFVSLIHCVWTCVSSQSSWVSQPSFFGGLVAKGIVNSSVLIPEAMCVYCFSHYHPCDVQTPVTFWCLLIYLEQSLSWCMALVNMRLSPDCSWLSASLICYNFPLTGFKNSDRCENKQPQHGCIYYSILRTRSGKLKRKWFWGNTRCSQTQASITFLYLPLKPPLVGYPVVLAEHDCWSLKL